MDQRMSPSHSDTLKHVILFSGASVSYFGAAFSRIGNVKVSGSFGPIQKNTERHTTASMLHRCLTHYDTQIHDILILGKTTQAVPPRRCSSARHSSPTPSLASYLSVQHGKNSALPVLQSLGDGGSAQRFQLKTFF